jgi:hypothetical protein
MKRSIYFIALLVLVVGFTTSAYAYEALVGPTGVLYWDKGKTYNGYTVFAPNSSKKTYMIDMEGNLVHKWNTQSYPGLYAELLPNGNLLRAGQIFPRKVCAISGTGGLVEEYDWEGSKVWSYRMFTSNEIEHHCFNRMPNGNTMILGWERIDDDIIRAAGREIPDGVRFKNLYHSNFWLDFVREVNRDGNTVWEWHAVDHLGKGPDQIDINYILPKPVGDIYHTFDHTHFNSVDYIPETDQVLMNSRNLSEIYLVNHKTGKIEYRWGNPSAYGKGRAPSFYDDGDQELFGSHDARWLGDGRVSIFDNGSERPEGKRSRVVVVNTKTNEIEWKYESWDNGSFYSERQGAAQPLPNGNWFVTSSNNGHVFEVTKDGKIVWDFVNPIIGDRPMCTLHDDDKKVQIQHENYYSNMIHRAYRYGPDYPGLKGKDLKTGKKLAPDCPEMFKIFK